MKVFAIIKKGWAGASIMALAMVIIMAYGHAVQAEPIKIGLMAPLTGPAAADGLSVKQSCEMLVENINAAGGINGNKI